MTQLLFSDNAVTTLAAPVTTTTTLISVAGGTGVLFPTTGAGQAFIATLSQSATPTNLEIVTATTAGTDTFNIVRGSNPLAFNAGDNFSLRPTAKDMSAFVQVPQLQAQAPNFAIDVGSANNYVVNLTPALTARNLGTPVRFIAVHGNTGNCFLNDGISSVALVLQPSPVVQCPPGTITPYSFCEAWWDGSQYQLRTAVNTNLYALKTLVLPGASLATNGWRENPDGSIEQWGTVANGGEGAVFVGFPRAFTTCFNVVSQCVGVQATVLQSAPSANGFYSTNGAAGSSTSWRAIGV